MLVPTPTTRRLTRHATYAVCAVALSGLATGCGKDAEATPAPTTSSSAVQQLLPSGGPSTTTAGPATGPAVKGDGYTLNLPEGWSAITRAERASEPDIDIAGRADAKGKDFTPNVNVVVTKSKVSGTATRTELNALAIAARAEVATAAPKLATLQLASLDGSAAVHQEGAATYGQVPYFLVQYVAIHDAANYVVTFTFPTGVDAAARAEVTDPVLASFRFS